PDVSAGLRDRGRRARGPSDAVRDCRAAPGAGAGDADRRDPRRGRGRAVHRRSLPDARVRGSVRAMNTTLTEERRTRLHRRVWFIVGFTITYNVIEAVVAITAGAQASSAALIGFGLDSVIEVASAAAVAWQFTRKDPERWEKATVRAIAIA